MTEQKKQKKKIPHSRNKILKFYLWYIKPYSDKIPYFREIAKNLWLMGRKFSIKLKGFWQSIDLEKIYWISPNNIKYSFRENSYYFSVYPDYPVRGKAFIQNWDLAKNLMKFEETNCYKGHYQHFVEGKEWQETEFYQRVLNKIESGIFEWGCSSEEKFIERCRKLDKLYEDIKNNGLMTQKMLDKRGILRHEGIREQDDEMQLAVDRKGNLIQFEGQNRLSIAKILDVDKIPFKIIFRHENWMKFRKEIILYVKKEMGGKTYLPLLHPDLSDIPSVWGNETFEIIKQNLTASGGSLLDIGAHWGYFCHRFEEIGFHCTAMEDSSNNLYFLKKLKQAGDADFQIIDKTIFDYEETFNFDVVLALDLFHHFLKGKESSYKLIKLLRRLRAGEIYFRLDKPERIKMKNNYKNYSPEEFVNFMMENSNFSKSDCIGEVKGHKIYKLSN